MTMNNLIAITGNDGVGKDTLGKLFSGLFWMGLENCGYVTDRIIGEHKGLVAPVPRAFIYKFAEIPNKQFKEVTGIDYLSLPREYKEKHRPLFASYCNWWRDNYKEGIWAEGLFKSLPVNSISLGTVERAIITDLRFKIEYDGIIGRGGKVVRIRKHKEPDSYLKDIATEYTIYNNGTLEEFLEKGVKLWEDVQSR